MLLALPSTQCISQLLRPSVSLIEVRGSKMVALTTRLLQSIGQDKVTGFLENVLVGSV